jgi:hypothetical protein
MMRTFLRTGRAAACVLLVAALFAACRDSTGPGARGEVAVVLNSVERSLSVVEVEGEGAPRTIGLGPEGTPVSLAVHGATALVPMGTYPFAAVVDLTAGAVVHMVALPEGSGATGVAFLNDSIAVVANPALNSVSPVNVRRGTVGPAVPVGVYPQHVVVAGGRVYVVNANLENFAPAGPGSITVLNATLAPAGTIALSGLNPGGAALLGGRLYVVNTGSWTAPSGSLSVVDLAAGQEIAHHTGFTTPNAVAASPVGNLFVGGWGVGLRVWNPLSNEWIAEAPVAPGETMNVPALGFDSEGRLYTVNPTDCRAPGRLYRLVAADGSSGTVARDIPVGVCPADVVFTSVPLD